MLKRLIILTVSAIVFSTGSVAQIKIKLPTIPKPETRQPTTTQPDGNKKVGGGDSITNRFEVMDDGFTYFDADAVTEYDSAIRLEKDVGWFLRSSLRMFGTFPARSGFNVTVSRAGKELAKTRCSGRSYKKASDPYLSNAARMGVDLGYDDYLDVADCIDKKQVVKGEGEFDVTISYFNGDTDAEKVVRKYKIDVHRASRVRGQPANPQPDVAHYYVSRHNDAPAAFMLMIYGQNGSYIAPNRMQPATSGRVEIYMTYSPVKLGDPFPNFYARCSVDGNRINFEGMSYADQVQPYRIRQKIAMYTDRLIPQYQRGPEYREEIAFVQLVLKMPIMFGSKEPREVKMEEHPGNWVCDVMADGKKFRTFKWTVGRNGRPVAHTEQASGNVNLFHHAYMLETEIPPGGSDWDGRLSVNPASGFWYGIPWSTAQGKAMASAVAKKGNPWPVPSNRKK